MIPPMDRPEMGALRAADEAHMREIEEAARRRIRQETIRGLVIWTLLLVTLAAMMAVLIIVTGAWIP